MLARIQTQLPLNSDSDFRLMQSLLPLSPPVFSPWPVLYPFSLREKYVAYT
jgi:hypothetical protein